MNLICGAGPPSSHIATSPCLLLWHLEETIYCLDYIVSLHAAQAMAS